MSVVTTAFGGVRLTNEDAKKFRQQLTYGKPKKAAKKSLARGNQLLIEYTKNGFVALKLKRGR